MKVAARLCSLSLAFSLLVILGPAAAAKDSATSQIRTEIARLEQSIKDKPLTDKDSAPIASAAEDTLKAAAAAVNSGKTYLALEKLGLAEDLLQAARAGGDKAAVEKGGLPAFQARWGEVSLRITGLDKEAHAQQWIDTPLAVRALAEAAQGKAIPLLEGGQGFAVATGPKDGLMYVGEAEGEADFARFCVTLKFAATRPSFPLRSLLPELQSLQTKVNAAFQPPQSIELHTRFIALNSQIKLAEELDASRFYAGALYAYLEAVRHYGMLNAAPLDGAQQKKLKQDIASEKRNVAGSASDDSLAQLFLERAESYTAHSDGSAPSADEWRGARVVVDQVLPAYYAAQKALAPLEKASGKTVELTLVRWPYT